MHWENSDIGFFGVLDFKRTRLKLTKAETGAITRAAKILEAIRNATDDRYGDSATYEQPLIDLALGSSTMEEVANQGYIEFDDDTQEPC